MKQQDISSFFGRGLATGAKSKATGPASVKPAPAKAAADESKPRRDDPELEDVMEEPKGDDLVGKKLKRLKRNDAAAPVAEDDPMLADASPAKVPAAPASSAPAAAAAKAASPSAAAASPKPVADIFKPAKERKRQAEQDGKASPAAKGKKQRAKSPPLAQAVAQAEAEVETAGRRSSDGGGASGSGGTTKARAKPLAAAAGKVDGVGAGALAAAKEHSAVDIQSLVTWAPGQPVPYAFLVDTFEEISKTTKRLSIIQLLVNCFRAIMATTPADLLPAVYLCLNRVAPPHAGIELGIGEATLIKALSQATGKQESAIKKEYESSGDLGFVAVTARSTQRIMFPVPPLTLPGVLKTFREIASTAGEKSQERKRGLIVKQLAAAKGAESGYIMRSLQGKLRIGLAEQSVIVALAQAALLHKDGAKDKDGRLAERLETAAQAVKLAYSECPSLEALVPALLEHPLSELHLHVHFMPGVPIKPMLAKATNGVAEVLDKVEGQEFTCEYKYDGERAQVHVLESGEIAVFSRNAENNTSKYPDIVSRLPSLLKPGVKSIVIDAEAVAYDLESKRILPFQVLSTRGRKDVSMDNIKVPVVLFAFDCLYLNGQPLLRQPLAARRQALYDSLLTREDQLQFAQFKTSRDPEELEVFLNDAVEAGTEGLIVKTLADPYEPSKRSSHWLKLKKDYLEGVGDTFDVVPIGAFHGKGKRTGVYGAYLLAVYDDQGECYQTISKLGTGFSEEQLQELAEQLRPHIIPQPRSYYVYSENLLPEVWFDAAKVWEVKAADLSISPVHRAAVGQLDPAKGISIRFPRLLRVRDDKNPEDATTASQVVEMYQRQALQRAEQKKEAKQSEEAEEEGS